MNTEKALQLLNQILCLLGRNIIEGIDRIHQEPHFRSLKFAAAQIIALLVFIVNRNVIPQIAQQIYGAVYGAAVQFHIIQSRQFADDLPHGQDMVLIRIFFQNLKKADGVGTICHHDIHSQPDCCLYLNICV